MSVSVATETDSQTEEFSIWYLLLLESLNFCFYHVSFMCLCYMGIKQYYEWDIKLLYFPFRVSSL